MWRMIVYFDRMEVSFFSTTFLGNLRFTSSLGLICSKFSRFQCAVGPKKKSMVSDRTKYLLIKYSRLEMKGFHLKRSACKVYVLLLPSFLERKLLWHRIFYGTSGMPQEATFAFFDAVNFTEFSHFKGGSVSNLCVVVSKDSNILIRW